MNTRFANLFNYTETKFVSWKELSELPVGVWIDFKSGMILKDGERNGIRYKKIQSKPSGQLLFVTDMLNGEVIDWHHHDVTETVNVIKGEILVNDRKKILEGGDAIFYKRTKHKVKSLAPTALLVEFTKYK